MFYTMTRRCELHNSCLKIEMTLSRSDTHYTISVHLYFHYRGVGQLDPGVAQR